MSHDALSLALAFAGGAAVGGLYFSTLWLSVRLLEEDGRLSPMFLASAVRLVAISGLVAALLAWGVGAATLLVGGLGFIVARVAATRLARPAPQARGGPR